ncbi:MAG: glycosyltransferase family 9 protein [Verrucomicrobia bacterium]|nr:glycosyltransferase family 9 protein [Verrucomicrobiota bacterium]
MKNKILVIRGGAIGDFILTLPVFHALKNQFPDCDIDVLGYPHIAQMSLLTGHVHRVFPIEAREMAGFFAKNGPLDPNLMEFFDTYGLILSYLFDPEQVFQANVGRATKAQFIAGPHRPDETRDDHATDVFLSALEKLAIFQADPVPSLSPSLVLQSSMVGWTHTSNTIAIHPGSGSHAKNWSEESWAILIQSLVAETDLHILLVGAEAERDRVDRLIRLIPESRAGLAFGLSLNALSARLLGVVGFVGHDSGISHLAAALGLSVIVLWPDTNPSIWTPRSPWVHRIESPDGIHHIPPMQVFGSILEKFQLNP